MKISKMKINNKKIKGFKYIVYGLCFNGVISYVGKTKRYKVNEIENNDNDIIDIVITSERWKEHTTLLEKNKHHNTLLQLVYNELKDKGVKIDFIVLDLCKNDTSATHKEDRHIKRNKTLNYSGRTQLENELIEKIIFNYFLSFFLFYA